uniref:Uncharacterized protein n=1 Tax=Opuntia streptacantha TaxID=393608 RepID=A0A7C9EM77_OPUST
MRGSFNIFVANQSVTPSTERSPSYLTRQLEALQPRGIAIRDGRPLRKKGCPVGFLSARFETSSNSPSSTTPVFATSPNRIAIFFHLLKNCLHRMLPFEYTWIKDDLPFSITD